MKVVEESSLYAQIILCQFRVLKKKRKKNEEKSIVRFRLVNLHSISILLHFIPILKIYSIHYGFTQSIVIYNLARIRSAGSLHR